MKKSLFTNSPIKMVFIVLLFAQSCVNNSSDNATQTAENKPVEDTSNVYPGGTYVKPGNETFNNLPGPKM